MVPNPPRAAAPHAPDANGPGLPQRVEIYDTTLRDGTQGLGVSLSLADKLKIVQRLDTLGVDYIEGGYPLSNPKDVAFFDAVKKLRLGTSKVCAFGMTRRRGISASDDAGMQALVASKAPIITLVGKTWDLHVDEVLQVEREENLAMIRESVAYCVGAGREVFYDAEHFFDGYRANASYALATIGAALQGGATHVILCDTNGGSLPQWVAECVRSLQREFGAEIRLGIHTHNDAGLAVANSLAAVQCGAVQVQGTINGLGERCGNVDLLTVAANLTLKLGGKCLRGSDSLRELKRTSRFVYEIANMIPAGNQPYVGQGAFAHKGGMHVHAVNKLARSYEHVEPESVGNTRRVVVSELSGVSNIIAQLGGKFDISGDRALQRRVLEKVQDLENIGYVFESAGASLELLLRRELQLRRDYWHLDHYRCVILRVGRDEPITEATVKLRVGDVGEHQVAEGDGPVNALDSALRKCLVSHYPDIRSLHLIDFRVRVINATEETAAKVRVIIDYGVTNRQSDTPGGGIERTFTTVGVSENIVHASWEAMIDAYEYHLLECGVAAA